ncbi:MAG: ureidoglycolate lyase [Pseudomonadota bacterium]
MIEVTAHPISAELFAPFGDVLDCSGPPDRIINQGLCGRFHDRARLDFGQDGRAGLSLFKAEPRRLPYKLQMMERHPDGSQAFISMSADAFLVTVARDNAGVPAEPLAFITEPGQAINFHRGTWHGVLTPLSAPGAFAVVDRIGSTPNIEEFWFQEPVMILGIPAARQEV